jgi:hypothetical protein
MNSATVVFVSTRKTFDELSKKNTRTGVFPLNFEVKLDSLAWELTDVDDDDMRLSMDFK